jgi:hypothetical protein
MTERERALEIANRLLETEMNLGLSGDACVLARQFIWATEELRFLTQVIEEWVGEESRYSEEATN